MRTQSFGASRFVALRLDPGEDVLLSLRAAVEEQAIRNAAILSGSVRSTVTTFTS